MINNSSHRPTKRFPTHNNTKTKTSDKTKYKANHTAHKYEQKQEVGNIHLHFPTNTQGHKHIQKHKCQDGIQTPKYHSQPHKPSKDHNTPPHNKWGIYQLTCNTSNLPYVGQTRRSLSIRFQERIRYIR